MSNGFAEELALVQQVRQLRQAELDALAPDTPHPTCACGRSLNQHLESDIKACDVMQAAMEGDHSRLFAKVAEHGEGYLGYAAYNLYRGTTFGQMEAMLLVQKLSESWDTHPGQGE